MVRIQVRSINKHSELIALYLDVWERWRELNDVLRARYKRGDRVALVEAPGVRRGTVIMVSADQSNWIQPRVIVKWDDDPIYARVDPERALVNESRPW